MIKKSLSQPTAQNHQRKKFFILYCFHRKRKELMDNIRSYKPMVSSVSQVQVLLIGAVEAGKSSFINSVRSVLKGRMCSLALADNTFGDCFTKTVWSKFDCVDKVRKHPTGSMSYKNFANLYETWLSLLAPYYSTDNNSINNNNKMYL